jgi:hypothetical protein
MFTTICAVVVLFVASMICVVGTCAVVKHFRTGYLNEQLIELRAKAAPTPEDKQKISEVGQQIQASGAPVDFGLGAIVVLFVASMVCVFLGRNLSPMTSSVSAYQSPARFSDMDSRGTVTVISSPEAGGSAVSDEVYKAPERHGTVNTPRPTNRPNSHEG